MSRVFVIQATRFPADVSPAAVYGNIIYVLSAGDRTCMNPDLSLKKLLGVLDNFDPEHDYILWSGGDPLSCMLTGVALAELDITRFNYLRYERPERNKDKSTGYYVPVKVDFSVD